MGNILFFSFVCGDVFFILFFFFFDFLISFFIFFHFLFLSQNKTGYALFCSDVF